MLTSTEHTHALSTYVLPDPNRQHLSSQVLRGWCAQSCKSRGALVEPGGLWPRPADRALQTYIDCAAEIWNGLCVCVALGQRLSEVTVSHTAVERTGPRVQRVWKVNGRKERGFHLDGVTFHWGESLTPFVRKTEKSERTFFPLLLTYYAYCVRALWGKLEKLMSWIISHNGSWQDNYTSLV